MRKNWWKEAVVYEIYPRSFNDSNGDGIGDIPGIIEKVDYLDRLGIDVVWLAPVYKSPNIDNGYDISDYRTIMDDFGTMDDWEKLLEELHRRDIKLVMDLVVNHTSDQHHWFLESRKYEDGQHGDYYIWLDGEKGRPPNNWESNFGGSAWEFDDEREEYYLHLFDKHQPDLNWENEDVREEVYELMTWWLEKGVDGFRMDVINLISKDTDFPDGDGEDRTTPVGSEHYVDGPKIHDYLQEMNTRVLSPYQAMTVGEMPFVTVEEGIKYTAEEREEIDMVYPFEHIQVDVPEEGQWQGIKDWQLSDLKQIITKWQRGLQEEGGWQAVYLNNHDQPRAVSRFGDDGQYWKESAKMLATLLLTLRGTPYLYQGEEIGMTNFPFSSPEEVQDVETLNKFAEQKEEGRIDEFEDMKDIIRYRSRDNARSPMQWNESRHAGFSDKKPWFKINPNYPAVNVENQLEDSDSIFNYYRELIKLRKENLALVYGDYKLILPDDEQVYAYIRSWKDRSILISLNFSAQEIEVDYPPEIKNSSGEMIMGNYDKENIRSEKEYLHPYEARLYRLDLK